jgi:hypothetical protein
MLHSTSSEFIFSLQVAVAYFISHFHRSALVDILAVLIESLHAIRSQKGVFIVIKCIITLLVDEDFEIRQKTSRIVSKHLRLRHVFMEQYAQELFLRHLLQPQAAINRDKVIGMIIIMMHEEEEAENGDKKSNHIASEFQVFEKNESSSFRESFAMRKLCLPILRSEVSCDEFGILSDKSAKQHSIVNSIQESQNLQEFIDRTFAKM